MLEAALAAGTADGPASSRSSPAGCPAGAGTASSPGPGGCSRRSATFRFDATSSALRAAGRRRPRSLDWLADWRFTGDIGGYAEGELLLPRLADPHGRGTVRRGRAAGDPRPVDPQPRLRRRRCRGPDGRPPPEAGRCIEMGSRRTHEEAAVAAARAAYVAGFAATSNLAAGRRYGVPTAGTAAHAFTLAARRRARRVRAPRSTSLGAEHDAAGRHLRRRRRASGPRSTSPGRSSARCASTPATWRARARGARLLDALGATGTRIVVTSDLDEYAIAALAAAPVDAYGVGTSVVTGSGAPTAAWSTSSSRSTAGRWPSAPRQGEPAVGGRKSARAPARRRHGGRGGRRRTARRPRRRRDRPLLVASSRGGEIGRRRACRRSAPLARALRAALAELPLGGASSCRAASRDPHRSSRGGRVT